MFLLGASIGSLFPDIDNETSHMADKFPLTSNLINKTFGHRGFFHSILFMVALFVSTIILNKINHNIMDAISLFFLAIYFIKLPHHKGIIKRIIITLILFHFLSLLLPGTYYFPFGLIFGIGTHLFCDLFTKMGVKLFYPYGKYVRLVPLPSGNLLEIPISIALGIGFYFVVNYSQNYILQALSFLGIVAWELNLI